MRDIWRRKRGKCAPKLHPVVVPSACGLVVDEDVVVVVAHEGLCDVNDNNDGNDQVEDNKE